MQLRGFGMTMDLERGTMRSWVIGGDGVKRWADTNEPVAPPKCPYCSSNNEAVRETYFDQGCAGCVERMTHNSYPHKEVTMLTHESEQLISLARADLEATVKDLEARLDLVTHERNNLIETCTAQEATVKEQAAEISELKRWRTSGIERSAKDSDIVSLYRQQLAAAQTEIERLKSQVNFWISEQSEQVTRTNAEIDDSNDLHQQLAEARAEITRLVEEIAEHVKARASDRASRSGSNSELSELAISYPEIFGEYS